MDICLLIWVNGRVEMKDYSAKEISSFGSDLEHEGMKIG